MENAISSLGDSEKLKERTTNFLKPAKSNIKEVRLKMKSTLYIKVG